MSFRLYVGNYPYYFTEVDVKELFKGFKGVTFDKMVNKKPKCYSFFTCSDMDELVDIIREMHNRDISGRRLVVRASDRSLQEYVDLLLQEAENDLISDSPKHTSVKNQSTEIESPPVTPEDPFVKEEATFQSNTRKKFSRGAKYANNPRQPKKVSCTSPTPSSESHSEYFSAASEYYATGGCDSELGSSSPRSNKNSFVQCDLDSLTWLSVTNFRYGTSVRSIYELFSDYNPIKVFMINNYYSGEEDLTEAFVGFENRDTADDVIMNFDNTLLKGRVILVSDIDDLSSLDELLEICHS